MRVPRASWWRTRRGFGCARIRRLNSAVLTASHDGDHFCSCWGISLMIHEGARSRVGFTTSPCRSSSAKNVSPVKQISAPAGALTRTSLKSSVQESQSDVLQLSSVFVAASGSSGVADWCVFAIGTFRADELHSSPYHLIERIKGTRVTTG